MRALAVLLLCSCASHRVAPARAALAAPRLLASGTSPSSLGSGCPPVASVAAASAVTPYVTRAFPPSTFDLLSGPIAPGGSITQVLTLAPGWTVTGAPAMAVDPMTGAMSPFVIDSATTTNGVYTVVAHNAGQVTAQLVADVPYSAIAPGP